jgi:hypothetical protein
VRASVLIAVVVIALAVTGCSGPGPVHVKPPTAPLASPSAVRCDQVITSSRGAPGARILFAVLTVPPAHLPRAAPTGTGPWGYFAKFGPALRANSPAVLVTIPAAWRHRAAIAWGNVGPVSSLRLLGCPRQLGAWNGYAGGFYLRSASGCVPVVFGIGRRTATLRFAIGRGCRS